MASSNSNTAVPSVVLVIRLLTLALLAASLAIIAADKINLGDTIKITFKTFYSYRYVLAVAAIGCAYTLIQIPFAAISIAKRKRVIGGSADVAMFLIYADMVFALLLATGAGAGFGFTYDLKHLSGGASNLSKEENRFLNLAYASSGLMLLAAFCITLMIMLSVYSLVK